MVQVGQAARFGISPKSASRWVPVGWVGLVVSSCRYRFRTFQLKLDILDTKNFGNGPVVEELQPFEVGRISIKSNGFKQKPYENPSFPVQKLESYDFWNYFGTLSKSVVWNCAIFSPT